MKRKKRDQQQIHIADAGEVKQYGDSSDPTPDDSAGANQRPENETQGELVRLGQELAQTKEKLLREKAEQQNLVKRSAAERAEAIRYANTPLLKALLGTLDDLERTLENAADSDAGAMLQGVRLIHDNLTKTFTDHNVEVIDALDKPFDPRVHEAMLQQPAEGKQPGTVIQVLQSGYKFHDRVLRPAKVIVASDPQDEAVPKAEEGTDQRSATPGETEPVHKER